MKKINKKLALELLSNVNNTLQGIVNENEVKFQIMQELDLVIKYINDLETDLFTLLSSDKRIIEYNVIQVEDLVEIFGCNLSEEGQSILYDMISENVSLIELGDWESIYLQVAEYLNKEFVFQDCPEIIEFIADNSIN
jgi:hypothetical protein